MVKQWSIDRVAGMATKKKLRKNSTKKTKKKLVH